MKLLKDGIEALLISAIASIVLVVLGIVYFGVILWVIKIASATFFGTGLEANSAVLAAALLSTGAIVAGALEKKFR